MTEETPRTALVTGGTRGIGLGIAQHLLDSGLRVAVNGVRPLEEVEATLEDLSRLGPVVYVRGDVGEPDGRDSILSRTLEAFGGVDVLVNNAGITSPGRKDMLDVDEGDFDRVMSVNLKGPFLLTQAVAALMIEQDQPNGLPRRCIINVSSVSSELVSTNRAAYCISKSGASMATKLWAARLADHDIDVYEVRPGIIATDMTAPVKDTYDERIEDGLTLERRWGTPDDIGAAVSLLASGALRYATGQVLTIDGGLTVPRL